MIEKLYWWRLRKAGLALEYASDEMKNNREVVLGAAVQQDDGHYNMLVMIVGINEEVVRSGAAGWLGITIC